ncbi:OmpA family protein [Algiphilus sp.]|uniref:OmpA family protein n=1 Tax=Algiphilus sp. TaxID=1872431 RepID=UPI0032EBF5D6
MGRIWVFGALCLGMFAGTAIAQSGGASAASYNDLRWYFQGEGGFIASDSSGVDNGVAGYLSVGKPLSEWFSLELDVGYASLDASPSPDYERLLVGVKGVAYLLPGPDANSLGGIRPFLQAGLYGHSIDFIDSQSLNETTSDSISYQLGGGFTYPLSRLFTLVASARYGIDEFQGDVRDDTYYTWTGTLGLRVSFGEFPPDSDNDSVPDHIDECPGTAPGVTVDRFGCPLDSDGDGVPDPQDRCPGTPEGVAVDRNGCPLDSDGDGVPDYMDQCPNTAKGERVDKRGCPFTDSDGDGVPDHMDRDPNTAPGVAVDQFGRPLDSDGDGVPDHLDRCPNTPPGAKVLPNGCALEGDRRLAYPGEPADADGFATERTQNFVLRGVNFEFDSSRLKPESRSILNQAAEVLNAYPNVSVDVEGHTDSVGTDAYNLGLSERRANAVKAYLTQQGISPQRMTAVGYGETVPIDTNETEDGRANNRRVEFRVR